MSGPLRAISAAFRRKLLAQPSISALPVCGACGRETEPRNFGRQYCKPCEAERAAVSAEWDREQWALTHPNASFPRPADPMFGGAEAEKPFLADDQD